MSKRSSFLSPALRARFAFLALCVLAAPVAAQKSMTIDRYDARVVVLADGRIDVTETITATFQGTWNGIYRKVPLDYRNGQGFNWSIGLELVSATDGEGRPLRTEQLRDRHYLKFKMWIPGASNATRTVVLHYVASNALRFFEDHDELYWNATGDEWDYALGEVTAEVTLPDGASGIRYTAFNGVYGANAQDAIIEATGRTIRFSMPRKLEFREGLTVVVGWDKGLIPEPTILDRVLAFFRSNWPAAIPIPVFALMFWLWWTRGRDPRRRPIMAQYEPPPGLTPAEAGTITDESVDMRDITATLVDLAVRGYLRIEEKEEQKVLGIFGGGTEYWFHRTKDQKEWAALAPHEQRVLEGVFGMSGTVVQLADLVNEFYEEIGGIKSGVMKRLVEKHYYRSRPDQVRGGWVAVGVILGLVLAFVGSAVGANFGFTPVPFIFAGVCSGLIIVVFGYNMPARTESGTRTLEHVLGFEEFLARVDSDRFARVVKTPEMFERFLPYAMAFGVEKQWTKAFKEIFTEPPNWYAGSHLNAFNAMTFSRSLSTMTHEASSAMTSQPRSSSGSGFSSGGGGGGSSGGGGGGGGGGGF
jgi:uncharacterized protein (TIGR04222 family)